MFCQTCGGYATYDPANGWIYMGWAVSGTTPFSTLGFSTELSGVHDGNSFNPDTGYVYASCGGCYYSAGNTSQAGQQFGNVVFVMGNSCGQPGPGEYYNSTLNSLCFGGSAAQPTITTMSSRLGVPFSNGTVYYALVFANGAALATGQWTAQGADIQRQAGSGRSRS